MKMIFILATSVLLTSCLLSTPPRQSSRPMTPALSDLDNLEMLLNNEQKQTFVENDYPTEDDNLRLGMQKNRVRRSLGSPKQVEVAGNPKNGIERWIYEQRISTLKGHYSERKVIYFEGGKVVGWEIH